MLRKEFRLRKNRDFKEVYRKKNAVSAETVVLYTMDNQKGFLRAGFSVSKKIGNAVVRNRCRRWMREAVRAHLQELQPGKDYVFVGRQPLAKADYAVVEKDILAALRRKGCLRS